MEPKTTNDERMVYLQSHKDKQLLISLTDFFFIEDGMYPDEFELILVVDKDGELSAGCVDKGSRWEEYMPYGVIRQSRGGYLTFDDIIAWKVIDEDSRQNLGVSIKRINE